MSSKIGPANLGTLLDACDTAASFTYANFQPTDDPTHRFAGLNGVSQACTGGSMGYIAKSVSWDLSSSDVIFVRFWASGSIGTLRLLFFTGSAYYQLVPYATASIGAGWNVFAFHRATTASTWCTISGSPNWANITAFRLQMQPPSGQDATIVWGGLYAGYTAAPWVVLSFDDGNASDYTIVHPLLQSHGWHATYYVPAAYIDESERLTRAQCDALYAAGNDISNHSATHSANLTALTGAALNAEIDTSYDTLMSYGYERSAKHMSYVGGAYNDEVVAATAIHHISGRTVGWGESRAHWWPSLDGGNYKIRAGDISTASWATVAPYVTQSVKSNTLCVLYGHVYTESSTLAAIFDGIAALQETYPTLRVGCMSEYQDWLRGIPVPGNTRLATPYGSDGEKTGTLPIGVRAIQGV